MIQLQLTNDTDDKDGEDELIRLPLKLMRLMLK